MGVKSVKELRVYQKAYGLAMEIFIVSKGWPIEEKYSLTDQIRRSSRAETDTWLDFARDCGYQPLEDHNRLTGDSEQVGAMLGAMLNNPTPFLIKARHTDS